jgi:hypothetical protein
MRLATLLLAVILLGGCVSSDSGGGDPTPTAGEETRARAAPPAPDESIPRDPAALARQLTATTRALYGAIDRWRDEGDLRGSTPEEVTLHALYQ